MNKYLSECIGTFVLVFAGTGVIITNDIHNNIITHVGISLTFGLAVLAMIYTVGDISGAHINPAVSLGFFISGRLSKKCTLLYILSQALGAIAASMILCFILLRHETLGATLPTIHPVKAFIFEIILTYILMFVITRVASGSKEKGLMAGVAVGFTIAFISMFAGPITGASMNPARSLGPGIVSGHFEYLWIYLSAPFIGAQLAVYTSKVIGLECCPENDKTF